MRPPMAGAAVADGLAMAQWRLPRDKRGQHIKWQRCAVLPTGYAREAGLQVSLSGM